MEGELSKWTETVWGILSKLPASAEVVADQRSRWDDLQSSDKLSTVIFGAYDSGKSTLLKRLLVEAGARVPEWLTISGRRETFEVGSVQAEEIVFLDTPGLSGGNDEHEQISLDAMQLADAYLWVLPPQLVTADKQAFLDFMSGRHFSDSIPASNVANATIAVVARMDEAGIDPADNPDGFRELVTRKTAELRSALRGGGVDADLRSVRCVAADPYQMVGSNPDPNRNLYDHGRDWDGIEVLIESLRSLNADRGILRASGGARFVARLACDARQELTDMITEQEHALEAHGNEIEHLRLSEQRLDALRQQSVAELRHFVEEELLHASRVGSASVTSVARTLKDSLCRAVDKWSESCFAEYRRLATEMEFDVRERMARPSFAGFRRLQEEGAEENPKRRGCVDVPKIGKRILRFGPELRKAFDGYAHSELGMDLKTAAERVRKFATASETGEAMFLSADHAAKASRLVKWAGVMDTVGPLVVQLGGIVFETSDEIMTAQRAKEREQRRSALMGQLRQEAEKIEVQAATIFNAACEGLRRWLHERTMIFENGQAGTKRHVEELANGVRRINEALRDFPTAA